MSRPLIMSFANVIEVLKKQSPFQCDAMNQLVKIVQSEPDSVDFCQVAEVIEKFHNDINHLLRENEKLTQQNEKLTRSVEELERKVRQLTCTSRNRRKIFCWDKYM